jgi:hypothetical protein
VTAEHFLRCAACGAPGPKGATPEDAEQLALAQGWLIRVGDDAAVCKVCGLSAAAKLPPIPPKEALAMQTYLVDYHLPRTFRGKPIRSAGSLILEIEAASEDEAHEHADDILTGGLDCQEVRQKHPTSPVGKLGTEWCAPGEGAKLRELLDALEPRGPRSALDYSSSRVPAIERLSRLGGESVGLRERRTNLRLTGEPLQEYDLQRIAEVEA